MKRITPPLLGALGALAAAFASPAAAQGELSPAEIEATTRYALPHAFNGYVTGCRPHLKKTGYVLANAERLRGKFAAGSEAFWPQAKKALMSMAAKRDKTGSAAMFANLPDDALRPFVDGLLVTMVTGEMKPELCRDVERGLAIMDPLPAENLGRFAAFLFELVERDEAREKANATAKKKDQAAGDE